MSPTVDRDERDVIRRSIIHTLGTPEGGKDELLRALLQILADRGMARHWAECELPYTNLNDECATISADLTLAKPVGDYLRANPAVRLSVHTFLAHLSVAANARYDNVPGPQRILQPNGIRIARWLPTVLVIDGPLGRFLTAGNSPLNKVLRDQSVSFPALAQARDAFNHDLFRHVRNGIGHWSFSLESDGNIGSLVCFDWKSGHRTAEVSLLEAEALHVVSMAVIECLDQWLLPLQDATFLAE